MLFSADIEPGESYTDGEIVASPDLVALLSLLASGEEAVNDRRLWPALAGRAVNFLHHLRRDNTPAGSRRNISAHYDLGNDFYRLFPDPTMLLERPVPRSRGQPGDSAKEQDPCHHRPRRHRPDDHVPEIGCGWAGRPGDGAVHRLPADRGDRVLEQHAWWNGWCARPGLEGRIEVQLTDYRHVQAGSPGSSPSR